jgi:hypothetical protein
LLAERKNRGGRTVKALRGAVVMTGLVIAGGLAGFWARAEENPVALGGEIADFVSNEWIYVGGVSSAIQTDKPDCGPPAKGLADPLLPACIPDPFDALCAINAEKVKARWKSVRDRTSILTQAIEKAFEANRGAVDRAIGRLEDHKGHPEFLAKWKAELDSRIRQSLAKSISSGGLGADSVIRNVAKAREYFETMLSESRLPPALLKSLVHHIRQCTEKPELNVMNLQSKEYAVDVERYNMSSPSYRWYLQFGLLKDHSLDLSPTGSGCSVQLTGEAWMDCMDGSDSCYQVLFHEFSHYMNSCVLRTMLLVEKTGTSTWMRKYSAGIQETENLLGRSYSLLKERSECLREISDPKEALFDALEKKPEGEWATLQPERCADTSDSRYPAMQYLAQWNEAEADFWGASAQAVHLRSLTPEQRRKSFGESIAMWCSHARRDHDNYENKYSRFMLDSSVDFQPPISRQNLESTRGDGVGAGGLTKTEGGLAPHSRYDKPKPWFDPHQDWKVRVNRNILRNSDLREVLGCAGSTNRSAFTAIPVTCSPMGIVRRLIP